MEAPFLTIGRLTLSESEVLLAASLAAAVLLAVALLFAWRGALRQARESAGIRAAETDARIGEMMQAQARMTGRLEALAEREAKLTQHLSQRLDGLGHRIGQSMTESTKATHDNLTRLNERLAVIDNAQRNITQLSGQVVELQKVLANKQTRGAFGEGRMQAIIQDGLPTSGYSFQATLSNGRRPDCLVHFPNGAPSLVVDAKFPLEGWHAIRAANDEPALRAARSQFRRDMQGHIAAIAERYLIVGETQDTAFMFVPSESIFADLNEQFEDVVQGAHRARVVIVSPSLLMLSIQVVQAILKDARMRELAHVIRDEVIRLAADVGRLDDRVRKLQSHFGQANKDIDEILISTRKVTSRSARIETLELGESAESYREPDLLAGE